VADSRGTTDFYRYIERRKDDMKTDESLATASKAISAREKSAATEKPLSGTSYIPT